MHVVVERSRVKMLLAFLGAVAFVVLSLGIITVGTAVSLVVGVLGVLTFGVFGVGWCTVLVRRGPGLVVDDEGFDDRSSGVAVGRVAWSDVTAVSDWGIFGTSTVVVEVSNPDVYLAQLSWLARLPARANRRMVGSPVTLASTGLKIGSTELSMLLSAGFQDYRMRAIERG